MQRKGELLIFRKDNFFGTAMVSNQIAKQVQADRDAAQRIAWEASKPIFWAPNEWGNGARIDGDGGPVHRAPPTTTPL
ncbi:hypothetical protein BN873_150311 [Candidatus Competibacter denitrificans Run_A_D11]|uniref:Uncharacterized protein n=1 Tax=Candidatus Competibacter denitrificans Run_A_D11 TaxID=1400863 RepID=W6MBV1_9GAMM|nr:hypothetical protein BN873_150311 [Candidatus Competibacter denitrificans Run_A_D11]